MNQVVIASLLPFAVFFIYNFKLYNMPDVGWKNAFILSAFISVLAIAFVFYKKRVINRIVLGAYLFIWVLAIAFLADMSSVLDYCFRNKGLSYLICLGVVGIITTFFSETGFIGVECPDQRAVKESSFKLLAAVGGAIIWSIFANSYYSVFISETFSAMVLSVMYSALRKKLEKIKNID